MRLRKFEEEALEVRLRTWDNQIIWWEPIRAIDGGLDGERVYTLADYDSWKEAKDALEKSYLG